MLIGVSRTKGGSPKRIAAMKLYDSAQGTKSADAITSATIRHSADRPEWSTKTIGHKNSNVAKPTHNCSSQDGDPLPKRVNIMRTTALCSTAREVRMRYQRICVIWEFITQR